MLNSISSLDRKFKDPSMAKAYEYKLAYLFVQPRKFVNVTS